jgi:hypothetical protein
MICNPLGINYLAEYIYQDYFNRTSRSYEEQKYQEQRPLE